MDTPLSVQALRSQLFANGYRFVPVATGGKRPTARQWPQRARALTAVDANEYPDGTALNTGILADGLVPIDFDCEDTALGGWIIELAQQHLGHAPLRFRANSAKWLMLYRSSEDAMRSSVVRNAKEEQILEVLGVGRQFVAYGMHPSKVEYQWSAGNEPRLWQRDALTVVSPEQLDSFMEAIARQVGGTASRTRQRENDGANLEDANDPPIPSPAEMRIANSVLHRLFDGVRAAKHGTRNQTLNNAALQLGELCAGWGFGNEAVGDALVQAAGENGLVSDDGLESVKQTIANGFTAGLRQPRARIAELPPMNFDKLRIGGKTVRAVLRLAGDPVEESRPADPRGVVLRGMAEVQETAIEWHWPGYLPAGMLTLLSGAGGTGKSTLAFGFAATVTTGGLWPDGQRCAGKSNVLIWSSEDDVARTIKPRLMAAGADIGRVAAIEGTTSKEGIKLPFDPSTDIQGLRTAVRQIGGIAMLIIDPIVSAVSGDMHKANDVRRSLQPIVDFAAEFNCAVLGITHFAKNTNGRNASERVIGSQAFAALARMVLVTAKEEESDQRVFTRAKSNISADDGGIHYKIEQVNVHAYGGAILQTTRVVWGGPIQGNAQSILSSVEGEEGTPKNRVQEAMQFLKAEVAGGSVPARELIERAKRDFGITERSLQRARERLGIVATKTGFQGAWVWSFKSTGSAIPSV